MIEHTMYKDCIPSIKTVYQLVHMHSLCVKRFQNSKNAKALKGYRTLHELNLYTCVSEAFFSSLAHIQTL